MESADTAQSRDETTTRAEDKRLGASSPPFEAVIASQKVVLLCEGQTARCQRQKERGRRGNVNQGSVCSFE